MSSGVQMQEQRGLSVKEAEQEEEEEEEEQGEREENIVLEKQLAWAEHRIKELEALIASAVRLHFSSQIVSMSINSLLKSRKKHSTAASLQAFSQGISWTANAAYLHAKAFERDWILHL